MGERRYTYDEACESLAAHFLAGKRIDEVVVWDLAQHIQDAVEMWFVSRSDPGPSDENTIAVPAIDGGET